MKAFLTTAVLLAALGWSEVALADGDVSCPAATRAERRPAAELIAKLKASGWTVRKVQLFNNCWEVYGFDENKRSVEAFFDPKTLTRVPVKQNSGGVT